MADPVSLGFTIALTAAQMAITASRKIEGPRVKDLGFTGGDYGAPLARIWGHPRLHPPVFFAEDLKEVKRRRKTKGGKFNDYTYYGTWACAMAGHQIEGVRRIWLDGHLAFDLSGTGPVTPFDYGANRGGTSPSEFITVYLGTPDQECDPRILATTEAKHGAGTCPAYRDTAYVVFKDLPLEKFGNRIPQPIVEVVGKKGTALPHESVTNAFSLAQSLVFSPDYSAVVGFDRFNFVAYDVAARAPMAGGAFVQRPTSIASHVGFREDGTLVYGNNGGGVYAQSIDGSSTLLGYLPGAEWGTGFAVLDGHGQQHWLVSNYSDYMYDGVRYTDVVTPFLFADVDGDVWTIGKDDINTPTRIKFARKTGLIGGFDVATTENPIGAFHYSDAEHDHFVVGVVGKLLLIDRTSGAILETVTPATTTGLSQTALMAVRPGAKTFWLGFREYSSIDLSLVRALNPQDWVGGPYTNLETVYDPVNHALLVGGNGHIDWYYLDRIGAEAVTLGTIVADVAEVAKIAAGEIDTSDLTQPIEAWYVTGGTGKDWLDPLLDIHDSDARPHGFTLEFRRRSGVSGGTIAHGRFAQPREDSPLYETPGAGGSDLPSMVTMQFADIDADQQPALAASGPLGEVDSARTTKLDMGTLGCSADEAHQLVARWHRRRWFEKQPYGISLSMQQAALEPADVRTLSLPGGREVTARLTSMRLDADRQIALDWRPDDPSLALLDGAAGAAYDGREQSTVAVPLLSRGFVLDVPLLSDGDEAGAVPQVYPLAAPFGAGTWPGATVYQAIDGEYSEQLAAIASGDAVHWGTVATAMPWASPNLWDRGTMLTVTMASGELTGCTEAAANADPSLNLVAIGANGRWELAQFTVATLTAPGIYAVSGFKRGRRGTEWAAELHQAGDAFVLVDGADPVAMELSEVGTDVSFKAITAGRTSGFPFGYTFAGQTLLPYAPVHLAAEKQANGDWVFSWVRRTRIGGAWTSGTPIPLGEASEQYALTVGDGVADTTITVTSPAYTWTLADQTTLTGSEVTSGELAWSVAQVSDAVGAGFLATA